LAQAVLQAALSREVKAPIPTDVAERPGEGLSGTIDGRHVLITGRNSLQKHRDLNRLPPIEAGLECVVLIEGRFAALFRFHDEPRPDSSSFIRHLGPSHQAKEVILLSGDRQREVEHMARFVGIEQIHAGKTPEEKLKLVQETSVHARTLFVGDGINDAPAMLAATASVALGGQSSDVVSEAADAVVLDSSLRRVDELIHIARRTYSIAMQSAIGGMLLSVLGMGLAAAGYLPPLFGAIAQEVIDLAAVVNALRVTLPMKQMSDF
jgi:P-type E1-E2 ATPase